MGIEISDLNGMKRPLVGTYFPISTYQINNVNIYYFIVIFPMSPYGE